MVIKAKSLQDAEELLHSGVSKVELAYNIGSDDFFSPGITLVRARRAYNQRSPSLRCFRKGLCHSA
ncbi:hypothetical protein OJE16_11265 [Pantoea tagorei]